MGPTWGPPGSCGPQMGPMLASWTLLSGTVQQMPLPYQVYLQSSNPAVVLIRWHVLYELFAPISSSWHLNYEYEKYNMFHEICITFYLSLLYHCNYKSILINPYSLLTQIIRVFFTAPQITKWLLQCQWTWGIWLQLARTKSQQSTHWGPNSYR